MHVPAPGLRKRRGLLVLLAAACLGVALPAAADQGVELATLAARRVEGELRLDFAARITLPKAVEEALSRGVPVYFQAQATLWRSRWYWRDERVARVTRSWRVAFQPLTGIWRVGLGGLNQSFASLPEALAAASTSASWKLADAQQIDPDKNYSIEFDYRLDTSQLPSPMQFGLVTQGDWAVGVTRTIKLD